MQLIFHTSEGDRSFGDKDSILKIEVSYKFKGEVFNQFKDQMFHNKFLITIKRGIRKANFDFYDSEYNWELGKKDLNERGLVSALDSIIRDSLSGSMVLEDFLREFGSNYENVKIWKACRRSYFKLSDKLYLRKDILYEISEAINEIENS